MLHHIATDTTTSQGSILRNTGKRLIQTAQWMMWNASTSVNRVFVGLFGIEHLTWTCLFRSCVASLLTVGVCLGTMVSVMGTGRIFQEFQTSAKVFGGRIEAAGYEFSPSEYLLWVLLVPLVMNVLADYLALYKTRRLVVWIEKGQSMGKACWALVIDQVGTYICFFAGLFVTSVVLMLGLLGLSMALEGFQEVDGPILSTSGHVLHLVAAMNQPMVMIPCVVSTFFSSIWLWLYALSIILPWVSQLGSWLGYRLRMRPT